MEIPLDKIRMSTDLRYTMLLLFSVRYGYIFFFFFECVHACVWQKSSTIPTTAQTQLIRTKMLWSSDLLGWKRRSHHTQYMNIHTNIHCIDTHTLAEHTDRGIDGSYAQTALLPTVVPVFVRFCICLPSVQYIYIDDDGSKTQEHTIAFTGAFQYTFHIRIENVCCASSVLVPYE